jgi:hypothetical protein
MTRLARHWLTPKIHHDGVPPETEYRIQREAARDCFARADAAPASLESFLHRRLGQRHAIAALKLLPPEFVLKLFRDTPQ